MCQHGPVLKDLLLKIHRVNPPKIFVRIEHLIIRAVGSEIQAVGIFAV